MIGVSSDYAKLAKQKQQAGGRFLNPLDIEQQREVTFISHDLASKFFNNKSGLGKVVLVSGLPFRVIGISKKLPSSFNIGISSTNRAYIPYTTAIKLWGNQDVNEIVVMPDATWQINQFQQILVNYLSQKFHFDPKDKSAMWIFNPADIIAFFNWFFRSIELFLGLCSALTLGVGGIGVANIMYLIVEEHIGEIGLRMALGARTSHILFQFLLEASMIVILGSLIGFIISALGIAMLHQITLPKWLGTPQFSFLVFLVTVITLALVGLCAGYFPARRAAQMTPVAALTF